ncbi:hypothetical protein ACA910_019313 [Epithemia clementina (nom. ined.)]
MQNSEPLYNIEPERQLLEEAITIRCGQTRRRSLLSSVLYGMSEPSSSLSQQPSSSLFLLPPLVQIMMVDTSSRRSDNGDPPLDEPGGCSRMAQQRHNNNNYCYHGGPKDQLVLHNSLGEPCAVLIQSGGAYSYSCGNQTKTKTTKNERNGLWFQLYGLEPLVLGQVPTLRHVQAGQPLYLWGEAGWDQSNHDSETTKAGTATNNVVVLTMVTGTQYRAEPVVVVKGRRRTKRTRLLLLQGRHSSSRRRRQKDYDSSATTTQQQPPQPQAPQAPRLSKRTTTKPKKGTSRFRVVRTTGVGHANGSDSNTTESHESSSRQASTTNLLSDHETFSESLVAIIQHHHHYHEPCWNVTIGPNVDPTLMIAFTIMMDEIL